MTVLDTAAVLTLARHLSWPAVSIYLTTRAPGMDAQKDRIAFKNLLRSAELDLLAAGVRASDADDVLGPGRALLDDGAFWRQLSRGLAVFLAEDAVHVFRTDTGFSDSATVSDRFSIRPLLTALRSDDRFFVLAFSKNQVRLFEGSREGLEQLPVPGAPASLAEATQFDDYEREVQFHSRTPASAAGRGRRAAVFHGHGGLPDVEKERLAAYARLVSRGVHDALQGEDAPLVLVGVEYMVALYREADSYIHTVPESVSGSPDDLSVPELHSAALEILEPHAQRILATDLERLEELRGTRHASTDLSAIVSAAHEGRVDVLFISDRETVWGTYDPSSGTAEIHSEPGPGDCDLADLATAETLLHGGRVHALTNPDAAPAAILRY